MEWISTERVGQISGSYDPCQPPSLVPLCHLDPEDWPLLNDTGRWRAFGFDECANTEHNGRLYFFSGDVYLGQNDFRKDPLNDCDLVAWTDDAQVLRHGGHLAAGYVFCLPHDIGEDANHQAQWRYCVQCSGLFFDGSPEKWFQNACPKGGRHVPAGHNFVLPHDVPEDAHNQSQWRYCVRCGALFFEKSFQICPKGGYHYRDERYNFVLPHDVPEDAHNQSQWRYCGTCGALFWDGDSTKGLCPGAQGGGFHLHGVLNTDGSFWPFRADPPVGIPLTVEMGTAAFSYNGRLYVFCGIAPPHWSGQTRVGDPTYGLYLLSTNQPDQPVQYRTEFLFNPKIGVCPADRGSHDVLGYNFVLHKGLPPSPIGPDPGWGWLRCRKCSSLFKGGASLRGGVCRVGGSHEGESQYYTLPYDTAEDALHQAHWRPCRKCHGIFFNGYSPQRGVCPADLKPHLPDRQVDFVLPHDYPEDSHHQANWRRCRKCSGMFWDGSGMKGWCPVNEKGHEHDAQGSDDIDTFMRDEYILSYDVPVEANHVGDWRFCTKCFGMFSDAYPAGIKGCCPYDGAGHTSVAGPDLLASIDLPTGYIRPPVAWREHPAPLPNTYSGYNFVLPHDLPEDAWHETGWRFCTKCLGLFRLLGLQSDGGVCPAGGTHTGAGPVYTLPHRFPQNDTFDRDWRFCTKCFGLVSTKAFPFFWTVASVVVRNKDCPGLPQSPTGDSLVILGYSGCSDFYLACVRLGGGPIRSQDTLYFAGTDQTDHPSWDPNVEKAVGLFGISNLADANHISMAWLECPKKWILLYSRQPAPPPSIEPGQVIARLGSNPWSWSTEIPIITPETIIWSGTPMHPRKVPARAGGLCDPKFSKPGTSPYGAYILNRFTELNESKGELGIYYLISLSEGYEVHLMHTRLSLWGSVQRVPHP